VESHAVVEIRTATAAAVHLEWGIIDRSL